MSESGRKRGGKRSHGGGGGGGGASGMHARHGSTGAADVEAATTSQAVKAAVRRTTDRVALRAAAALKDLSAIKAFALYSLVVLVSVVWGDACEFVRYDLKSSTVGCSRIKTLPGCQDIGSCLTPEVVKAVSPHLPAKIVAQLGPLPVWLALFYFSLKKPRVRPFLVLPVVFYLVMIQPTRHLNDYIGWEPSGHMLVYALQLVPLYWLTEFEPAAARDKAVLGAWAYTAVLVYLTVATAAFHHRATETAVSWGSGLLLLMAMRGLSKSWMRGRATNLLPSLMTAMQGACIVWLVCTVMALFATMFLDRRHAKWGVVLPETAFDFAVILIAHWAVTSASRGSFRAAFVAQTPSKAAPAYIQPGSHEKKL